MSFKERDLKMEFEWKKGRKGSSTGSDLKKSRYDSSRNTQREQGKNTDHDNTKLSEGHDEINFRRARDQVMANEAKDRQDRLGVTQEEAARKKESEIRAEKIQERNKDVAMANRESARQAFNKMGVKLNRKEYNQAMRNADMDMGIRNKKDPLGLSRASKREMKSLTDDTLFSIDTDALPSSRRRTVNGLRSDTLSKMEKSKKRRKASVLTSKRGTKIVSKKRGYTKKQMDIIERLRSAGSKKKGRGSKKDLVNAKLKQARGR